MPYNTEQEVLDALYLLSPPGDTIAETIEARNISLHQFAVQMKLSESAIQQLLNGSMEITAELSQKLEVTLGVPADFWTARERNYRKHLAEIKSATKDISNQ